SFVAVLLATAVLAVAIARAGVAAPIVYGICLAASSALMVLALLVLLGRHAPSALALPIGLPLVGAHFRIDALSAFFLAVANLGTLALLLAFGLLAGGSGGYVFDQMRGASAALPGLVLILALIGAGSKAGLVPLHVWLPLAHPAAPSHVSALMSGVMTKVAVYGFIRVIFDLLGQPSWPASVVVLFLGGTTAVMGILYAMMENDLKRL